MPKYGMKQMGRPWATCLVVESAGALGFGSPVLGIFLRL